MINLLIVIGVIIGFYTVATLVFSPLIDSSSTIEENKKNKKQAELVLKNNIGYINTFIKRKIISEGKTPDLGYNVLMAIEGSEHFVMYFSDEIPAKEKERVKKEVYDYIIAVISNIKGVMIEGYSKGIGLEELVDKVLEESITKANDYYSKK